LNFKRAAKPCSQRYSRQFQTNPILSRRFLRSTDGYDDQPRTLMPLFGVRDFYERHNSREARISALTK
jgi:hypothetical protein